MPADRLMDWLRAWLRPAGDSRPDACHCEEHGLSAAPAPVTLESRAAPAPAFPGPPRQPDDGTQAIGRLTAGVAHDFNNLLTVILGNAGSLRLAAEARGNAADARRARAIEDAALRGGRIAGQLLAFARKQVLRPEAISAYALLSEMHDLLSRAAGDRAQTRLFAEDGLWRCRVDPAQFESAILNLVLNARDAMPSGGTITITCSNQDVDADHALRAGGAKGAYVRIDVADTGTGIAEDIRGRLFDPFFTTKPVGQGSGLGLAQVHGFVGQSGGWVELRTELGHGTTFSLFLPRAPETQDPAGTPGSATETRQTSGFTVLLAEPDPKLRGQLGDRLRRSGHAVIDTPDLETARRRLEAGDAVDLFVADVTTWPEADTAGFVRACRKVRPGLAMLMTAAPDRTGDGPLPAGDERCEFLRRPVTAADLARVCEALLKDGTFARAGERLYSELRQYTPSTAGKGAAGSRSGPAPPPRPARALASDDITVRRSAIRLGVLPVRTLDSSRGPEISLGLAEQITTAFSRFRGISCVSAVSIASLAGESAGRSVAWDELDLDYLLEGSFRHADGNIRIIVRLLNLRQPEEIFWAKPYEGSLADILTLQDRIAADTAAQVAPELLVREGEKAARRPQVNPTSYSLTLQAIPAIYRLDQAGFETAGPLLRQALERDPYNAAAHSWLAQWYMLLVGQGWARDSQRAAEQADEHAHRAVTLDPGDARALTVAGHIKAFLHKKANEALQLHEQALQLNASLALAWCYSGLTLCYLGRHTEALERIRRARDLSPRDPHGFFFDMAMTMPLNLMGEYEAAAEIGRRARDANPGLSSTYKGLLWSLGYLGQADEAAALRRQLSRLEPDFTVRSAVKRSPLTRPEDLRRYAEGLRRAGLPEGSGGLFGFYLPRLGRAQVVRLPLSA